MKALRYLPLGIAFAATVVIFIIACLALLAVAGFCVTLCLPILLARKLLQAQRTYDNIQRKKKDYDPRA